MVALSKKILTLLFFLLFMAGMVSCRDEGSEDFRQDVITVNGKSVSVEIADTGARRAQGLMYRELLEENSGMLFIFQEERYPSFWMKNTQIPLSVAYISRSGEIRSIHSLKPYSEKSVRSRHAVLYALEMNQGWFERNSVEVGDMVVIPPEWKGFP